MSINKISVTWNLTQGLYVFRQISWLKIVNCFVYLLSFKSQELRMSFNKIICLVSSHSKRKMKVGKFWMTFFSLGQLMILYKKEEGSSFCSEIAQLPSIRKIFSCDFAKNLQHLFPKKARKILHVFLPKMHFVQTELETK